MLLRELSTLMSRQPVMCQETQGQIIPTMIILNFRMTGRLQLLLMMPVRGMLGKIILTMMILRRTSRPRLLLMSSLRGRPGKIILLMMRN